MTLRLRAYGPGDLDDVREVCVRTGAAGEDATGTLPDDGLLADVYAEPYVVLEPDLASVVEDAAGGRVVGYVVGTADTDAFVAAWRERWLPTAARRHPDPVADPATDHERLVARLHRPEAMRTDWVERYPAHLHVDLLPEARARGLGRALVERFCEAAAAAGASGVHLGVAADNLAAQAFYRRIGLEVLESLPSVVRLGRRW